MGPVQRVRAIDGAAWLILVAVALAALFTFRDYGLGWDDYTHAEMGDLLLSYYGSGFKDVRALSFVNLYMYGGGFDMLAALVAKVLPYTLFEERRLVGAAVGLVGLFFTWRLGRRTGGPLAGLLALALLVTCPLFYGHIFINAKDAPFAVAMVILLLGIVRAIEEYPQPKPATVVLFGIGLGLTLGTRIMGGMAALYVAAALALLLAIEWRARGLAGTSSRFGAWLWRLAPGFLLAYAVMAVVWPWSVVDPLNPFRAVGYFSHFFEKPWREIFAGDALLVPDMPRAYLPVLLGLKLPEIFALGALAGIAVALARIVRAGTPATARSVLVLIVAAVLVPVAITIVTRPAMYNGIRHFLFIMPPLAVLGGIGIAATLTHLRDRRVLAGAAVAVVIGLSLPVVEIVRLHPYQYAHFNHLAGGIGGAKRAYMLDYWGLAFKEAANDLRARLTERLELPPYGRKWKIAVCGPQRAASVELGPEFEISWDSRNADFALMLGEFYCADIKAPVLAEVEREGVTLARAYDIRGRTVSTLLTVPPP